MKYTATLNQANWDTLLDSGARMEKDEFTRLLSILITAYDATVAEAARRGLDYQATDEFVNDTMDLFLRNAHSNTAAK